MAERQSCIHVFQLPDLSYLTCIGNGKWSGPVFQAQALTVKDGLIFARDKNGQVSIYKESDATTENYQKTQRYRQASANGSPGNNAFAPHYMEVNAEGNILLTDYEGKKIRVLNPALVNDDFKNGTSIDLDDQALMLDFKPKTFAVCGERWYATGDNDAINIYDSQQKRMDQKIENHQRICVLPTCPYLYPERFRILGFGHSQCQKDIGENGCTQRRNTRINHIRHTDA